jgi:hypothetical protein
METRTDGEGTDGVNITNRRTKRYQMYKHLVPSGQKKKEQEKAPGKKK